MDKFLNRILKVTEDGSHTLYLPGMDEHFHSKFGAVKESEHVFMQAGFEAVVRQGNGVVKILETGFGTGLNALMTLFAAKYAGIIVEYTGIELYPVSGAEYEKLNYGELLVEPKAGQLLLKLHASPWEKLTEISPGFSIHKVKSDLMSQTYLPESFNLVYFDVFAPEVQPELWSIDHFKKLYDAMAGGGLLVTYASKGQVRRDLASVGFRVERLEGPAGKRHMLRGRK